MGKQILLTGASGFIGKALKTFLLSHGYEVLSYDRKNPFIPEGLEAIIHLAGESIATGLWTKKKKQRILESRVQGTLALVENVKKLSHPPRLFLSASAVGYYGNTNEPVTEEGKAGDAFLSTVCQAWEAAAKQASSPKTSVIIARLGLVLAPDGGLLHSLLPLFRFGLGSVMGPGSQFLSWIAKEDLLRAFLFILNTPTLEGAVNLTAPHPVTQRDFARTLAKALNAPLFLHLPSFLLPGQKLQELLLTSQQVIPQKLLKTQFTFLYPSLPSLLTTLRLQN